MPSRALRVLLPTLFFLAWAVLFSYPLVLNMGSSVVLSSGGDAWLHLWDLWWVDKALVDLRTNPYFSTYLYFPTGFNLYYHSLDLLNALASIPLQRLVGLVPAFNLLVLANLTLDGLTAYWLCLERSRSVGAGLVGGAIFASAPLLGTSLDLGQLDEITVWWIPLYLLALWRALESSGPVWSRGGGRRASLAAGVCLIGASLATWYFTAGLVIFTAVFVPAYLLVSRTFALRGWAYAAGKVGVAAGLMLMVLSPLLAAMIGERLRGETYMLPTRYATVYNSADLAALFLPPRLPEEINLHGSNVALGYVALALAIITLIVRWRQLWPLGLSLLVLVLMAVGPELKVNGVETGVPLPYALLNNVPFIGASRQPLRFLATAGACLSLLAAFGTAWLLQRLPAVNMRAAVVAVLVVLAALETWSLPRTLASTQVGPAYSFIRDDPQGGAVLEVPNDAWSSLSLLHQTHHGRPIIGGYTSRHFPYPFADGAPGVAQLVRMDPDPLHGEDILTPSPSETALFSLDHYDVRYVVVHKDSMATGRYGRLESVLSTLFTAEDKAYEDDAVIVYRSPSSPSAGGLPLVGLGSGWHRIEQNPLHRWTGSNVTNANASIWLGIPPGAEGTYGLKLNVYAFKPPNTLSVLLDGRALATVEVGTDFSDVAVELGELEPGDYQVTLQVAEPPQRPPGDERTIGIGVTTVIIDGVPRESRLLHAPTLPQAAGPPSPYAATQPLQGRSASPSHTTRAR